MDNYNATVDGLSGVRFCFLHNPAVPFAQVNPVSHQERGLWTDERMVPFQRTWILSSQSRIGRIRGRKACSRVLAKYAHTF